MKNVLAIYYSQTGQLRSILDATMAPLRQDPAVQVTVAELKPAKPYPCAWPFWRFFNTFPETVYEEADPILPLGIDLNTKYDLVILAYPVWFLSPSMPTTAFLQSPDAKALLAGRPVITLIGCRNMWLMAQERVKERLADLGARLIDNVVLTDSAHSAFTFVSTPVWMLTGKRGPFLGGLIPAAGVSREAIADCARFGRAIARQLPDRAVNDPSPMLAGTGAVHVSERLIASEKIAKRSFMIWGRLLRSLGKPGTPVRQVGVLAYFVFLFTLIITVVPISAVIKKLITPLTRATIARQRAYFASPSGETRRPAEASE